jgi:NAD(P)-dependent dehydrogenase (short-subunit alcohol dehydrogenase family)
MRLEGKKCLVTAAAQGIGEATARAFAAEGAEVWATDINEARLAGLASVAGIRVAPLDVLRHEAIVDLAKRVGTLDVLFNCAGYVHHGTVLDATDDEWRFAFDLNVRSMFWTIRSFLPGMLASGRGGSIVNVASAASSVKGAPLRFVYGTTKAAIIGLTKSVAVDYVRQHVRCNAICPGTVQTPSLDERIAALGGDASMFKARQPVGRFGTPQEIAALAVWLASEESAFVTGQAHVIDGGWSV